MQGKAHSVLGTLRTYGENTSAHGIPRAVTTTSPVRRLFWTGLFLASFSYFFYQAVELVDRFIDYPVTTDIKIQWSELEFPAVTVCNANPLRFSELVSYGGEEFQNAGFIPKPQKILQNLGQQLQGLGQQLQGVLNKGPPQGQTTPPPTTTTTTRTTTQATTPPDESDYDYDYDNHHEDFTTVNTFTGLIANMNSSTRQAIGHQARDLIQECQFDGRACSAKNFSVFTDSTYGNCFTFNKADVDTATQSATSAGPLHGLSLILYIEQEEYIPRLTEKAGARVVVHSPYRWPFPEFEGFDAPPGFLTSAGLRLTSITRLGGRYGDCTDGTGYELLYPGAYTQTNCLVTCHQYHMVSVCGCADASLMAPVNTTFCGSNSTQVRCENKVKMEIATGLLPCSCPASCSDKVYGKAIGLAEWPADSYLPTVLSKLQAKPGRRPGTGVLGNTDKFRRNLLKLNIYYEALNFEEISESPEYEVESLLGDLGGQLGLWVGMSLLSAMEIIEVIADLLIIFFKKCNSSSTEVKSLKKKIEVVPDDKNIVYVNHAFAAKEKMPVIT